MANLSMTGKVYLFFQLLQLLLLLLRNLNRTNTFWFHSIIFLIKQTLTQNSC